MPTTLTDPFGEVETADPFGEVELSDPFGEVETPAPKRSIFKPIAEIVNRLPKAIKSPLETIPEITQRLGAAIKPDIEPLARVTRKILEPSRAVVEHPAWQEIPKKLEIEYPALKRIGELTSMKPTPEELKKARAEYKPLELGLTKVAAPEVIAGPRKTIPKAVAIKGLKEIAEGAINLGIVVLTYNDLFNLSKAYLSYRAMQNAVNKPYDLLGVKADATPERITARYRELARQYHPDVSRLPKEEATKKFAEISTAYNEIVGKSIKPLLPEVARALPETPGAELIKAMRETVDLTPASKINAITIKEAGERIVAGDKTVLPHIRAGVVKLGVPTMEDNLINKGVEPALAKKAAAVGYKEAEKGFQRLRPGLNEALKTIPSRFAPKQIYEKGVRELTADLNKDAKKLMDEAIGVIDQELVAAQGTGTRGRTETGEWYGITSTRPSDLLSQPLKPGVNSVLKWKIARNRLSKGNENAPANVEFLAETGETEKAKSVFNNQEALKRLGFPTLEEYNFFKQALTLAGQDPVLRNTSEIKEAREVVKRYERVREKITPQTITPQIEQSQTPQAIIPPPSSEILKPAAGLEYEAEQKAIAERQTRSTDLARRQAEIEKRRQIFPLKAAESPLLRGLPAMQEEMLMPKEQLPSALEAGEQELAMAGVSLGITAPPFRKAVPVEFHAGLAPPAYVKEDIQKAISMAIGKTGELPYDWNAVELRNKPTTAQYLPGAKTDFKDENITRITKNIEQRMKTRRSRGEKQPNLAKWRDVRFGLQDMEEKTGVPVYQAGKSIFKAYADVQAETADRLAKLFEGTGITPAQVVAGPDIQMRVADHISGKLLGITEGEKKLAENIRTELADHETLVKQLRHDRWMRTGEMPPDIADPDGLALMKAGRKIYRSGDMAAYKNWLNQSDFGVREAYLPGLTFQGYVDPTLRGKGLGRGFTKTREGEYFYDSERPLLKELNKYIKRALAIEQLEPKIKDLYQIMKENNLATPHNTELLDYWQDMLLGKSRMDLPGKIIKKTQGLFWQAQIPQKLAKWVSRNLMQPTVYVLPKLFSPFDPFFWKNVGSLYSGFRGMDVFKGNRELLADPVFKDNFRRYVSSLDALGREYFFMEGSEFETLNRFGQLLSEMAKGYSWSDDVNRIRSLITIYNMATDSLARYRANPTPVNFNRFLSLTGANLLEDLELKDVLGLVAQNKDKEAAFALGKIMADNTNFMYKRAYKGLVEQGPTAQTALTIFTFAKGSAQDIMLRGIKPFIDWSRAAKDWGQGKGPRPDERTTQRAYAGIKALVGLYLASLAVNKAQEKIMGLEKGSYGLGTLRWVPGGVFISTWSRAFDDIWKAIEQRKGWDYALAQGFNTMGRNFMPFYDIMTKAIAAQKGVSYYSPPLEIRNKIKEWSGTASRVLQKKWVERTFLEQMQYIFFGGSSRTNPETLAEAYVDFLESRRNRGIADKQTQEKKKEVERLMRLYPATERTKKVPREARYIGVIYPGITSRLREIGIKKKKEKAASSFVPD